MKCIRCVCLSLVGPSLIVSIECCRNGLDVRCKNIGYSICAVALSSSSCSCCFFVVRHIYSSNLYSTLPLISALSTSAVNCPCYLLNHPAGCIAVRRPTRTVRALGRNQRSVDHGVQPRPERCWGGATIRSQSRSFHRSCSCQSWRRWELGRRGVGPDLRRDGSCRHEPGRGSRWSFRCRRRAIGGGVGTCHGCRNRR